MQALTHDHESAAARSPLSVRHQMIPTHPDGQMLANQLKLYLENSNLQLTIVTETHCVKQYNINLGHLETAETAFISGMCGFK